MRYCESRFCGKVAGIRRTYHDERIAKDVDLYFCSEQCVQDEMMARHDESKICRLIPNPDNPADEQ